MSDFFAHIVDGLDGAVTVEETKAAAKRADMTGQFSNASDAFSFMTAGKATVTFVSKTTGNRFTYRISKSDDGQCYFVGLLNGPNNSSDYKYMGYIRRGLYCHGRRVPKPGDISLAAPSAKAFAWSWQNIVSGRMPDNLEVWHEGRCGRCARKLTVPSSVASGFGPECQDKLFS